MINLKFLKNRKVFTSINNVEVENSLQSKGFFFLVGQRERRELRVGGGASGVGDGRKGEKETDNSCSWSGEGQKGGSRKRQAGVGRKR